jgi:hypothetical protein
VRLSVADRELRRSDRREEPRVLGSAAEDHLTDALATSGRVQVVHRRFEVWKPPATGSLIGANWILYGTIEESKRGSLDGDSPDLVCEVFLHARVIRVEDGLIIYSKRCSGTAQGPPGTDVSRLMDEATRNAAVQLADELVRLASGSGE